MAGVLDRTDVPFIRRTEAHEKIGQYVEGTTFEEALVPFRRQWLLYDGTADSSVGVAVMRAPRPRSRDVWMCRSGTRHSCAQGRRTTLMVALIIPHPDCR